MNKTSHLAFVERAEKIHHLVFSSLKNSSLLFFAHIRYQWSGQLALTTNHVQWYDYLSEKNYDNIKKAFNSVPKKTARYQLWLSAREDDPMNRLYKELRAIFKLDFGLTISDVTDAHLDCYLLAGPQGKTAVLDEYLNQLVELNDAIAGYQRHAEQYLQAIGTVASEDQSIERKDAAMGAGRRTKLSRRELQCALHCREGRTAKETAEILNLSRRTVEYYLEKVKIKLDCTSKYQLITKLYEEDLIPPDGGEPENL